MKICIHAEALARFARTCLLKWIPFITYDSSSQWILTVFNCLEICFYMLFKRDFYTLIFEKVPTVGGGYPPPTPSPRSVASLPRRGPHTKCAPFEILPLQNSKCSGALECVRAWGRHNIVNIIGLHSKSWRWTCLHIIPGIVTKLAWVFLFCRILYSCLWFAILCRHPFVT